MESLVSHFANRSFRRISYRGNIRRHKSNDGPEELVKRRDYDYEKSEQLRNHKPE